MDISSPLIPPRFPATPPRPNQIPLTFTTNKKRGLTSPIRCRSVPESGPRNRMFILGMGFVGQFFAQDLRNQGWDVSGTCTSIAKKKKLEDMGLNVHVFDANEPEFEVLNMLNHHTHLLVSIPPCVGTGDPMLLHGELLRRMLVRGNLQWLCYLSSTSVYGDCGGAWVDETYQPSSLSEVAQARVAAEGGWLSLGNDLGLAAQVFRLGGIYGPGRSAVDTITKQGPLSDVQKVRSFNKYTSRVHVADICNALDSCIRKPFSGRIFNIVDDDPAPRTEVFSFAQSLIEKKWPSLLKHQKYLDRTNSSLPERISRGEKRVSNARMKKELGVRLIHPSYKSGLQRIIDEMDTTPIIHHDVD